jgi:hypothetical protein
MMFTRDNTNAKGKQKSKKNDHDPSNVDVDHFKKLWRISVILFKKPYFIFSP